MMWVTHQKKQQYLQNKTNLWVDSSGNEMSSRGSILVYRELKLEWGWMWMWVK